MQASSIQGHVQLENFYGVLSDLEVLGDFQDQGLFWDFNGNNFLRFEDLCYDQSAEPFS